MFAVVVTDAVAALMNDQAKDTYTFPVVLPYLNMALAELAEEFQLNNVPVTNEDSEVIEIDAATDIVVITVEPANPDFDPHYPADLVDIQQLWQRNRGVDPWIQVTRREFLPLDLVNAPINQFTYWVWENQEIRLLPANADNDLKIDYIANKFTPIVGENDEITIINAQSFLQYRTAALCSEFIGENPERGEQLNNYAVLALDRVEGISAKGRQSIITKRRPYMAARKARTWL